MILDHTKNFYQDLFSRKLEKTSVFCSEFLNQINTPKLSPTQILNCDKALDISELSSSLDSMPDGKSPGNDGLTAEFYKFFWPLLNPRTSKGFFRRY